MRMLRACCVVVFRPRKGGSGGQGELSVGRWPLLDKPPVLAALPGPVCTVAVPFPPGLLKLVAKYT